MNERLPSVEGLKNAGLEPLYRAAIAIAAVAAAVMFFIDPLMNLLVVFGVPLGPEQASAIADFVRSLAGIGAPLAVAASVRPEVYAPKTVEDILYGPDGKPAGPEPDYDFVDYQ